MHDGTLLRAKVKLSGPDHGRLVDTFKLLPSRDRSCTSSDIDGWNWRQGEEREQKKEKKRDEIGSAILTCRPEY